MNSEIERLVAITTMEYERMIGKLLKSVGVDTDTTTENIKTQLNDRGYALEEKSSCGSQLPLGRIKKHIQIIDADRAVIAEDTLIYNFSLRGRVE